MRNLFKTVLCALMVALCISANASESQFKLKKVLKAAGKELEREWNAASSESTSASTSSTTTRRRDDGRLKVTSEVEGIVVKVKSCTADDNDNVTIVFTLENTNNFTQEEVSMRGSLATAYDDEGNVYKGEDNIKFASGTDQFFRGCWVDLPIEIPTKYRMRISDVDPAATVLKEVLIQLDQPLHTDQKFQGKIYLRNVPITRQGDE